MQEQQQERGQENTYRTPLQKWVDALHVFDNDIEEYEKEDDALYLIKQYARLQLPAIFVRDQNRV